MIKKIPTLFQRSRNEAGRVTAARVNYIRYDPYQLVPIYSMFYKVFLLKTAGHKFSTYVLRNCITSKKTKKNENRYKAGDSIIHKNTLVFIKPVVPGSTPTHTHARIHTHAHGRQANDWVIVSSANVVSLHPPIKH